MVGIVVVSHSPALAGAAVDLALQMVHGQPPAIAIAAGAGDGVLGTDAARVAEAIGEVDAGDGVLVLTDLGSAVLSAELALELAPDARDVRLSDAPFVEGLIAAVVLAAAGAGIDEVQREATDALAAKRAQLGGGADAGAPPPPPAAAPPPPAAGAAVPPPSAELPDSVVLGASKATKSGNSMEGSGGTADALAAGGGDAAAAAQAAGEIALPNADGLHARPAALLVKAVAGFDATVTVSDVTTGKGPASAGSLIAVMSLGAARGHVLRLEADGPDAAAAVSALVALVAGGFGEG